MKTIMIAGGSGLVGKQLTNYLVEQGHEVRWLSRKTKSSGITTYQWDVDEGIIEEKAFDNVNVIINLAGAGIADKRWTSARKKLLIESRTKGVQVLEKYINRLQLKLDVFINASAIGYYGDQGDQQCSEISGSGEGFLSQCCVEWEHAVEKMQIDCPRVIVRIGIVLSTQGGALEKMLLPLKVRTNSYFGNGQQWMSWIHLEDLSRLLGFLVNLENLNDSKGPIKFNAVADNPMRNKEFVQEVAKGMDIMALLVPAPVLGLRLAMGEMADVVLESTYVSNQKIKELGFEFDFDEVTQAVADLNERRI